MRTAKLNFSAPFFAALLAIVACGADAQDLGRLVKQSQQIERECAAGNASSCTSVGVRKAFGTWGYTKDYPSAVTFMRKGCDGGDPHGCYELGVMHEHGRGVAKDLKKAAELYGQACTANVPTACHNLGTMHRYGRGVEKNPARASEYYRRACNLGSKSSCKEM